MAVLRMAWMHRWMYRTPCMVAGCTKQHAAITATLTCHECAWVCICIQIVRSERVTIHRSTPSRAGDCCWQPWAGYSSSSGRLLAGSDPLMMAPVK
jgi:hypothetical protein